MVLEVFGLVVTLGLMALVLPGVGLTLLLVIIEWIGLDVAIMKLDLMRDDESRAVVEVLELLFPAFAEENATRRTKQAK